MALTFSDIKDELLELVMNDKTAIRRAEAAAKGSYHEASLYAARVGDLLGRVLRRHAPMVDISEWDLEGLIPPALGLNHSMIAEVCVQAQTAMNKKNGFGIRAVEPKFDGNRAYGIVAELRANPEFINIEQTFYDQLTNFDQNVVDEAIRANAELQSEAGIHARIIRIAESGACPWCQALAGVYEYEDVKSTDNEVWHRHENCRCTVDYAPDRSGRRQNAWTKEWRNT